MSPRIALDNYYVVIYSISAVAAALFICFYMYLKARKTPLLNYYMLTQLMLILWTFSKVLKTAAPSIHLRWAFIVIQYLGICSLGVFLLMFAYIYSTGRVMKVKYACLLSIPPIFSFVTVLTNPLHMKFYSYFDMYRDSFGPLFYLHQSIVYLYLFAGIVFCAKDFGKQFGQRRMQSMLFAAAILFPIIINLLYVFKVLKLLFQIRLPMDITPISCIISLLIFAVAALKYRFLDITPIAYKKALEQSTDAIMLISLDETVVECNKAFIKTFGDAADIKAGQKVKRIFDILLQSAEDGNAEILYKRLTNCNYGTENITLKDNGIMYLKAVLEPVLDDKNTITGNLLRFVENTSIRLMIDELSKKNLELSKANNILEQRAEALRQLTAARVRNYMAKEVHDIMGHSVVLVVSMLEVALINMKKGEGSVQYIENSIKILREGLTDIDNSVRENKAERPDNQGFFKSINLMAEQIKSSGVDMEITLQGEPFELSSLHTENVYKICREAVTNAVRHGKADFINFIFRFSGNRYDIYIIDNGAGCISIKKGMGLSGMEDRAAEIGGVINCNSYTGEGFSIHLAGAV